MPLKVGGHCSSRQVAGSDLQLTSLLKLPKRTLQMVHILAYLLIPVCKASSQSQTLSTYSSHTCGERIPSIDVQPRSSRSRAAFAAALRAESGILEASTTAALGVSPMLMAARCLQARMLFRNERGSKFGPSEGNREPFKRPVTEHPRSRKVVAVRTQGQRAPVTIICKRQTYFQRTRGPVLGITVP